MNLRAALMVLLPLSTLSAGCGVESPDGGALQDGGWDESRPRRAGVGPSIDLRCESVVEESGSDLSHFASITYVGPVPPRRVVLPQDCVFRCQTGFMTCPASNAQGYLVTGICGTWVWDSFNCGGCGVRCPSGQRCNTPGNVRNPTPAPVCGAP